MTDQLIPGREYVVLVPTARNAWTTRALREFSEVFKGAGVKVRYIRDLDGLTQVQFVDITNEPPLLQGMMAPMVEESLEHRAIAPYRCSCGFDANSVDGPSPVGEVLAEHIRGRRAGG